MKKFLFLFFLILSLAPNVYASEFNMNSLTSASKDGTKNRYRGVEIVNTGMPGTFTFGTRYIGKLSTIETYFDYPFEGNTTYTLTYNMNTEDFRNNFAAQYWWDCDQEMNATNQHVGNVSYISYKKVKFTFKPTENTTCIRVLIGSSNQSSQAITGISNWRLDSITLYDPDYQSGSGGGQGSNPSPSPSPSGATNQDIINNQDNNTQDIINNNNQNTQDIIENNSENTDKIIDNQNDLLGNRCTNLLDFPFSDDEPYTLIATSNDFFVNSYYSIDLQSGVTYHFSFKSNYNYGPTGSSVQIYLYKDGSYQQLGSKSGTFSVANTGTYRLRFDCNKDGDSCSFYDFMISKDTSTYCAYNSFFSKLDDLNDTMKDDNIDDKTGFFTDFEDNDHGLTSIITLPLSTIQNLTNSSCVALSVPIPFTNESVNLPCMSEVYQTYIPSIYNIWQIVSFGLISYFICLDIYKMVKGFKDPNEDKVEVLDL